jgi:hypothetical protein
MRYITTSGRDDGFGAQLQHILFGIMYAKMHNATFVYRPIRSIEHNYDNNPRFLEEIEEFLNIRVNYLTVYDKPDTPEIYFWNLYNFIAKNFEECLPTLSYYKSIFWKNKKKPFTSDKIHIAIHVRRPNQHDNRIDGADTPDEYFLGKIKQIREKYPGPKEFHVYSQGSHDAFIKYESEDVKLHLNEDIRDSFLGLVSADILVTSNSSFSYSAAILTDGIVYCIKRTKEIPINEDLGPLAEKWHKE